MAITVEDIKLLESERLTDSDNGGGRMTGSVVDSGEVNNLFPDISRLDRTYGRLSLRKAYMAVQSLNTDVYLGAHVIVTDPPDDPRVATTLFTTDSPVDERSDAQNRIESYVTRGPLSPYFLFGTQPQGAKAITLMGRVETSLPEVGEVLVLSVEDAAGVVASEQYVRIQDISAEERDFEDTSGEYRRKVLTVTLTSALRQTFVGAEATRYSNVNPPTKVRNTTIADATRYYGVTRLDGAVLADSLEVNVETIFSQIVPSTQREVPFAGARPGLTLNYVGIAPPRSDTLPGDGPDFLFRGVLPKSVSGGSQGLTADDGAGHLLSGSVVLGDIDYESGRISGINLSNISYTPAVAVQRNSYTIGIEITLGNQGTVYVQTLAVPPAPKTLRVDYRYLGKWYTLEDKLGTGTLAGATPGEGGGTIDYQTGNVVVTLGALPDVGSRLIFSAGQNTDFQQRAGTVTPSAPVVEAQLQSPVEAAEAATFTWISGGVQKSAVAAATTGVISGDATGTLLHRDGFFSLAPSANAWPDSNSSLQVAYTRAAGATGTVSGIYAANVLTLTLPPAALPLQAGGLLLRVPFTLNGEAADLWVEDDGAGNLVGGASRKSRGNTWEVAVVGGSVDSGTGEVAVQFGPVTIPRPRVWVTEAGGEPVNSYEWEEGSVEPSIAPTVLVQYWATTTTAGTQAESEDIAFPGISIYLNDGYTDTVVPGSVWFSWGGKDYIDRQGKVFRDMDRTSGAVTEAGSIDYQSGEVRLTNWGTTTGGNAIVHTLLTSHGTLPIAHIVFRTPGAPIRPGSLYLQAVRADTGALISGTSTTSGPISAALIDGYVDHDMGWVEARFGEFVAAAGNENEPWYHPDNVVGANVFKPIPVDPSTITFNCVVLTNLPLDADLLGIDPVRLPQSGRVPMIRDGDVVVIHEARNHQFAGSVTAGQVIPLPDAPVSQVALVDSAGTTVPIAQYTADLVNGTVTMANPMDLGTLVEPLSAAYIVEDMVLVSGVELSGKVSLVSPISRDYGDGAWVSSALLFGDLRAENPVFHSQQTWSAVWSDERIGSNTTAQYNRTLYPIELVNAHAVTERWALIFTGATAGNIVGETLGVIGTFNTSEDAAPINPVTGQPYFTLRAAGWGAGWAANNVLRFNTVGPNAPIWIARTVLPGASALADDGFRIQMRGDAD